MSINLSTFLGTSFQGNSGFSGFSGTNGTIGSNGASGFSGISGFSGTSGFSGILSLRVSSTASITSPLVWNSDNFELYAATAQAGALTINADSGAPSNGKRMVFRFTDNGTARALTWTAGVSKGFREVGVILPTTTVVNKTVYVGCIFNSFADRWDVIAVSQEI